MIIGMLWFDNSKDDLATKINRAAIYYERKHGRKPDTAFIHPSAGEAQVIGDVNVKTATNTLPHHIWIGLDKEVKNA